MEEQERGSLSCEKNKEVLTREMIKKEERKNKMKGSMMMIQQKE